MPLLPQLNVQKRVVQYLLRRLLGRFLLDPHVEGLDADLGRGQLSLKDLRLNFNEINSLISHLPLEVKAASLKHVSVVISTPLSWSSTIQIKASGLDVEIELLGHTASTPTEAAGVAQSVVESILLDEEPPQDLQQSLLELSMVDDGGMPGAFEARQAETEVEQERGVLAGVLEGLMQRLRIEASDICIRLSTPSRLDFAVKADRFSLDSSVMNLSPTRQLQLDGLRVDMRVRTVASRKSSDASVNDMAMSMAVADLRDSQASLNAMEGSSPESEASVYASVDPLPTETSFRPLLWTGEEGVSNIVGDKVEVKLGDVQMAVCTGDIEPFVELLDALPQSAAMRPSPARSSKSSDLFLRCSTLRLHLFYALSRLTEDDLTSLHDDTTSHASRLTLTTHDASVHLVNGETSVSVGTLELDEHFVADGRPSFNRVIEFGSGMTDGEVVDGVWASARPATGSASTGRPAISATWPAGRIELAPLQISIDVTCMGRLKPLLDSLPMRQGGSAPSSSSPTTFSVACPSLLVRIRSPRASGLPVHRMSQTIVLDLRNLSSQSRGDQVHVKINSLTMHVSSAGAATAPAFLRISGTPAVSVRASSASATVEVQEAAVGLDKAQWDSLQLWSDDMSRFFAARPTASTEPSSAATFKAAVKLQKASAVLRAGDRSFDLSAGGLRLGVEAGATLGIDARIATAVVSHSVNVSSMQSRFILAEGRSDKPAVQVRLRALDGGKKNGSRISGALSDVLVIYTPDLAWLSDLTAFVKAPAGAFEDVAPAERTDVDFVLKNVSIALLTRSALVCGVYSIEEGSAATSIRHEAGSSRTSIVLSSSKLLLKEDERPIDLSQASADASSWTKSGFVGVADLQNCRASIVQATREPLLKVNVVDAQLRLGFCSDSLASLGALSAGLSAEPTASSSSGPTKPARPLSADAPDLSATAADLMAADLLSQSIFVDQPARPVMSDRVDTLSSSLSGSECRCRALTNDGLQIKHDYMRPRIVAASPYKPSTEISLERCSLSIELFSGFDWEHTRTAIRQQVKAVRRRLVQIRQVLADGQVPEETPEETSAALRQSIYVPLPNGVGEAEADDLLDALAQYDESDEWQDLPIATARHPLRTRVSDFHRSLHRAPQHAVAFEFGDLKFSLSLFERGEETSRMMLTTDSFEIVDNLSSSTWHKFLTEMRVGDGGVARPTGAPALRVELVKRKTDKEETSLKIKVVPLRLFVDQDALDFLKTFFAPKEGDANGQPAEEAFLQRVEIFPVKVKLDYKPKRVDYQALQRGRTIELMNFFAFEGSEMTLRRITLSGVRGWSRLSDLLQDIWTPDVKTNQLADFLAGISPVRSVVNVGNGVADLVLLPLEQYRKDGRVSRGLQRGALSFGKTTTREALKLGARLATGTQVILEQAEAVIGARFGTTHAEVAEDVSKYASQPVTARQGLSSAAHSLGGNLRSAAQTIFAVPLEVFERSSADGPMRAVVRATPIGVVFRPAIGATEAISKALHGLSNQLDPAVEQMIADKYKPTRS